MATPVIVQAAILGTTVSTGEGLEAEMMERPGGAWGGSLRRGGISPGPLPPGWTSSVHGAGGGAQAVAPATATFTRALTPTVIRQMGSVTARYSWPLTPDL